MFTSQGIRDKAVGGTVEQETHSKNNNKQQGPGLPPVPGRARTVASRCQHARTPGLPERAAQVRGRMGHSHMVLEGGGGERLSAPFALHQCLF